jgi:hypothetical protein
MKSDNTYDCPVTRVVRLALQSGLENSANALLMMPDQSRRCEIRLPRPAYDALLQRLLEGAYRAAMFASPVKPTLSDWS